MAADHPRIDLSNRLALSIGEAASVLGVSESSFRAGVMPSIEKLYIGRRVLISVAALRHWVDQNARTEDSPDDVIVNDLLRQVR